MPALVNKKNKKIISHGLVNKTKKNTIARGVRFARTSGQRAKGLMFERAANFNYALVFELPEETRMGASVHMMFVFFPIDIAYLNQKREVVDVVENLKPWALNYTPKKAAKYFVETPAGTVKAKGIGIGDVLEWE